MNLFVIGNGFDMEHGLNTSYVDFRRYIENEDWGYLERLERLYGFVSDSCRKIVEEYLWKEFESKLSVINDSEIIDIGTYIDLGLEGGDVGIEDTLDTYWEDQYGYIKRLNDYIKSWIEQINIDVSKKTKKIKPNGYDMFITFNYTLLLEKIYHVDEYNILHIHGSISKNELSPVIGHGDISKINEAKKRALEVGEEFLEKESSIYNALANYYERTFKDTKHYLYINNSFFKKLHSIDQIFVVGHSLGDVDMLYFSAIKVNVKQGVAWNIYYHSANDEIALRNKILSIGVNKKNIRMLPSKEFFQ